MASEKKGISLSLGSGLKKGFVRPSPSPTLGESMAGGTKDVRSSKTPEYLIPLKEEDRILKPITAEPKAFTPFNSKKYGLQLRSKPQSIQIPTPLSVRSSDEPPAPLLRISSLTEEEKLNRDLERMPGEPSTSAYSEMPVEEFGLALLRGMGWKGTKEDLTKRSKTESPKPRPPLLGLGAKVDQPSTLKRPSNSFDQKPNNVTNDRTSQSIKLNDYVEVTEGPHRGCQGKIMSLTREFASIRLEAGLVDVKLTMVKGIRRIDEEGVQGGHVATAWPGAIVKIVDNRFPYHNQQATILDSHRSTKDSGKVIVSLRLADSSVLHDVLLTSLHPVIPKHLPSNVIILDGEQSGHMGLLLEVNRNAGIGSVQSIDDPSIIYELALSGFTAT